MPDNSALRKDRLKALREQHGWSRRELSRLCGLGEASIGKYETGEIDPTATSLKILADHLDVSTDYLLGISDDPTRKAKATDLSDEEYEILDTFRRMGWRGVLQLVAEQIPK
jgi:repressor LexA